MIRCGLKSRDRDFYGFQVLIRSLGLSLFLLFAFKGMHNNRALFSQDIDFLS